MGWKSTRNTLIILAVALIIAGCAFGGGAKRRTHLLKAVGDRLTNPDAKAFLDFFNREVLTPLKVPLDPTCTVRKDADVILPEYDTESNCFIVPEDLPTNNENAVYDFYRNFNKEVVSDRLYPPFLDNHSVSEVNLASFLRNYFLMHEVAIYLRHQNSLYNSRNPHNEEFLAQRFPRGVIALEQPTSPTMTAETVY